MSTIHITLNPAADNNEINWKQKYEELQSNLQILASMENKLREVVLLTKDGKCCALNQEEFIQVVKDEQFVKLKDLLKSRDEEIANLKIENQRLQGIVKKCQTQAVENFSRRKVSNSSYPKPPNSSKKNTLTRSPTKHHRLDSENWSPVQLKEYFELHRLGRIERIFYPKENLREGEKPPLETLIFEKDQNKTNVIVLVRASIDILISLITLPENSPLKAIWDYNKFISCFLVAFQTFITPKQLLGRLIERFNSIKESPDGYDYGIKASVINFIREWIRTDNGYDFTTELIPAYEEFTKQNEATDFGTALAQLLIYVKRKSGRRPLRTIPISYEPEGPITRIFDISPIEMARQLTLMEETLFSKIKRTEYLQASWNEKTAASNLLALIAHGNRTTAWITTEILRYPSSRTRCEVICYFITVLQNLEMLLNFNGMIQVLSSLHSSTICKLKSTWAMIAKKDKDVFDRITNLMSTAHHYRNYRDTIAHVDDSTACIPLISLICSDIYTIDDTLPNYVQEYPEWINWVKIERIAQRILEAKNLAKVTYSLKPLPEIQMFITNQECWNDDDICYEIASLRDKHPDNEELSYTRTENLWKRPEMSQRDWTVALTGAQVINFRIGDLILKTGETNRHLYLVKSGALGVYKKLDGENVRIATLTEGAIFGEISMLLRSKKQGLITVDVVAASHEAEVYQIEINLLIGICETDPDISTSFGIMLAKKLANMLKEINKRSIAYDRMKTPKSPLIKPSMFTLSTEYIEDSGSTEKLDKRLSHIKRKLSNRLSATVTPRINDKSSPTSPSKTMGQLGPAKSKEDDEKFQKLFSLINEIVLRKFACYLKKKNATGLLYVSQNYLCFYSVTFGFKIREKISLYGISDIQITNEKEIQITYNNSKNQYYFTGFRNIQQTYHFIREVWQVRKNISNPLSESGSDTNEKTSEDFKKKDKEILNKLKPTPADWELILKGSKLVKFQKGEYIIREGQLCRGLFQVARGCCRIEKTGISGIIGYITQKDDIFGEIGFLEEGRATASVIANEDTQVNVIEAYFLNVLFQHYPALAGRFYLNLAKILALRIAEREIDLQKTSQSDITELSLEDDLITGCYSDPRLHQTSNLVIKAIKKEKQKTSNNTTGDLPWPDSHDRDDSLQSPFTPNIINRGSSQENSWPDSSEANMDDSSSNNLFSDFSNNDSDTEFFGKKTSLAASASSDHADDINRKPKFSSNSNLEAHPFKPAFLRDSIGSQKKTFPQNYPDSLKSSSEGKSSTLKNRKRSCSGDQKSPELKASSNAPIITVSPTIASARAKSLKLSPGLVRKNIGIDVGGDGSDKTSMLGPLNTKSQPSTCDKKQNTITLSLSKEITEDIKNGESLRSSKKGSKLRNSQSGSREILLKKKELSKQSFDEKLEISVKDGLPTRNSIHKVKDTVHKQGRISRKMSSQANQKSIRSQSQANSPDFRKKKTSKKREKIIVDGFIKHVNE